MLHCGAIPQSYDQLRSMNSIHYAPLSPTHKPVAHFRIVDMFKQSLKKHTQYSVVDEEYGVSGKKGTECFGAISLRKHGDNNSEYEIFFGFRHSNSMKFSLRGGLADKFFICDNMAFHIENEMAGTKHTSNINTTAQSRIDDLCQGILPMDISLHQRNERFRQVILSYKDADHLLMELMRKKALQKTRINLVDDEWRKPSFKYDTNGISLLDLKHAFTHVAKGQFYGDQIKRSQIMHKVFDAFAGA